MRFGFSWAPFVIATAVAGPAAAADSDEVVRTGGSTRELLFPVKGLANIKRLSDVRGATVVACSDPECRLSVTVGWDADKGGCVYSGYKPIVWLEKSVNRVVWVPIPDRTAGVHDVRFATVGVNRSYGVKLVDRFAPKELANDVDQRVWNDPTVSEYKVAIDLPTANARIPKASAYKAYFSVQLTPGGDFRSCGEFDPIIINDGG